MLNPIGKFQVLLFIYLQNFIYYFINSTDPQLGASQILVSEYITTFYLINCFDKCFWFDEPLVTF